MTIRRSIALVAVALLGANLLAACAIASGEQTTEPREVTDATKLDVESGIGVIGTLGSPAAATVSAPADVQDRVVVETIDDTLRIHLGEALVLPSDIDVALTIPTLTAIAASGGAFVEVDDLAVEDLTVETSGGARVTASGTAGSMTLQASGGSRQELAELVAATVELDASGGAVIQVQATDEVSGSASGGSRVNVAGAASVRVETSGGANLETE
jgi:hypothetical protein